MTDRAPKLVVFDLGRVLVRICDDWRHACEVARVPWPGVERTAEARARIMEAVGHLETAVCDLPAFCERVGPELGLSADEILAVWDAYTRESFPGAAELLDDLRAAGVPTACLSNTNARHWQILTDPAGPNWDALSRLDHRFASHLIPARKPDGPAYEAVERGTGYRGDAIVFFDDLAENIEAAKARRWRAHLVPRCENPIPMIREVLAREGVTG
ncbi:MAG TPA: HAD-IA family hydrolase [Tepidisphaeraceae bacterium]|nr:HAD-IA family hydrolase [Tepidisphaeraceae bacterium]